MARILIIEDDLPIATLVRDHLVRAGHVVELARDGDAALRYLDCHSAELVLLDVMLPGRSGLDVCRELRGRPGAQPIVIMLTARTAEEDAVAGYEVGADDYVRKPFGVVELLARIEALLHLAQRQVSSSSTLTFGPLCVDPAARRVSIGGQTIVLTHLEFDMLLYFAERPQTVITREQLLAEVWGYRSGGYSRTVDSHVTRVRKKLRQGGLNVLTTVHAAGYRFEPPKEVP